MIMKKGVVIFGLILLCLVLVNPISADTDDPCSLSVSLVNQDPHPALPGEYVEVLFQITGLNRNCPDGAAIDLILDYPFSLDDGRSRRIMRANTYAGYDTVYEWNSLYKIRIDENAVEGDEEVELRFKEGSDYRWETYSTEKFNISIEEVRTDFEVHIEEYIIKSRTLTFEILNIGENDIEALTVEIPKQEKITVKGSNRKIVGDLDSNEYTTTDFEATPSEGEITVHLYYTDSINERRMLEKTVYYDPIYFVDSSGNAQNSQTALYIILLVIILAIAFFIIRRRRNNNKAKKRRKFKL